MVCRSRTTEAWSGQNSRARPADLDHLVYFVNLLSLIQPDRSKNLEKQAGSRSSRAMVGTAGGLVQYPASLPFLFLC